MKQKTIIYLTTKIEIEHPIDINQDEMWDQLQQELDYEFKYDKNDVRILNTEIVIFK